jgi:hypothetical protein
MTEHDNQLGDGVTGPGELPVNASMGELNTEIDLARHEAARTLGALMDRVDVKSRVRRATHERVQALRWDGRRLAADLRAGGVQLLDAAPDPVATGVRRAADAGRRAPWQLWAGLVVLLLVLRSWRRHRS